MEFNNIGDCAVKHKKTSSLFDGAAGSFPDVDQVKYGRQDFIHSLNVLNLWIQAGVNVKNPGHIIISISFSLQIFVAEKGPILLFVFPVDEFEFLTSGAREVWDHKVWRRS